MKTPIKNLFLLPVLIAALGMMLVCQVTAQTFTALHTFDLSDGANPPGGMILSGNTFYGETYYGGVSNSGTLFAIGISGNNFTNLYDFTGGSDGANPNRSLILSSNTLYGVAKGGGTNGSGSVFAIHIDGSGFTNLYSFTVLNSPFGTNSDGANPNGGLTLSGNTLYGTTLYGGSNGDGTVFAINTDGTDFTNLHSFNGFNVNDGAGPGGGLILSGDTLYGTTFQGGSNNDGTVFAISTNGTGFTNLYNFTALSYMDGPNSDGAYPASGLILSGNTLYGTTTLGGYGGGTIFAINIDGTSFTNLYNFNTNGFYPVRELILSGNTLYGTTTKGGNPSPDGKGIVFAVNTNGTDFTALYLFSALSNSNPSTNSDGANPESRLVLSDNILYGTTAYGGSSGVGTVFSLSLPLQLVITLSGTNVILSWPTDATNFTLQSTTNLVSPAVWSTNSLTPFIVNGQNIVTNLITGSQMFYRLSQ
jgi:uncharacterized repeat protein (TIGR03803 family)